MSRLRRVFEGLNTRRLTRTLLDQAPDAVICTHFLPAQILSRLRQAGTVTAPTWVVVTDFDVHLLWAHQGLSGYCVADEEVAWRIRERGIGPGTAVHVTGIPIMPAFATRPDRATCAAELGLDPARTTLLLMGGGGGVGGLDAVAERLLRLPGEPQLLACAGRNADLLRRLEVMARPLGRRLKPLGFTATPERLMAAADLAVSKPGGLTTSECLAMGLPMLVVSPVPGQEERNSDYLLEHGVALKAHDAAGLEYRARALIADPARLRAMGTAAAKLGRPGAAAAIVALATSP
jgi:processive 1,2-diacylglycerol beta-glucosyltransferase